MYCRGHPAAGRKCFAGVVANATEHKPWIVLSGIMMFRTEP
jgi:hypothetical protein